MKDPIQEIEERIASGYKVSGPWWAAAETDLLNLLKLVKAYEGFIPGNGETEERIKKRIFGAE